jgi:hypothetical protein
MSLWIADQFQQTWKPPLRKSAQVCCTKIIQYSNLILYMYMCTAFVCIFPFASLFIYHMYIYKQFSPSPPPLSPIENLNFFYLFGVCFSYISFYLPAISAEIFSPFSILREKGNSAKFAGKRLGKGEGTALPLSFFLFSLLPLSNL